jgi:two-component system nitrogen regulation sensor histidine kinase NtrY
MIFKNLKWSILLRVVLIFVSILAASWVLVTGMYIYAVILLPVIVMEAIDLYRFQQKAVDELNTFVESVHAPTELQTLRKGFNQINSTFKVISKEKETQYQYLQKILELVDTGILSYETETGEIVWMNESLKKMLQVPYLKTIHSLKKRDEVLYNSVLNVKPGDSKIADATLEKGSFKVLISATAFQTDGKIFNLIAFQNINEAMDETESKAWQKLLGVMTHEIMNSVAPISSLADTLKNRLEKSIPDLSNKTGAIDDLEIGIETIKRRSEGLLKFAETYRNLNKISQPNLKKVLVRDLFETLFQLMQPTLDQKNIQLDIVLKEPNLAVEADTSLVEQVLINLLVNAIEAVKDNPEPKIILSADAMQNNKVQLKITDNGAGMTEEVMEKIFIPFFSTKKSGSGIGLSLCKQIMMLHKGNIQVQSKPGRGTAFVLQF